MASRSLPVLACLLSLAQFAGAADTAYSPATQASTSTPSLAQRHFIQYCSGCHLADASGSPTKGIPSMLGTLGRFLQTPGGRDFIVQVPGVMNSPLKDREVAELMNWLLPYASRQTLPPGIQPYTEAEVARLRQSRPVDVPAARSAILQRARSVGIEIDASVAAQATALP